MNISEAIDSMKQEFVVGRPGKRQYILGFEKLWYYDSFGHCWDVDNDKKEFTPEDVLATDWKIVGITK